MKRKKTEWIKDLKTDEVYEVEGASYLINRPSSGRKGAHTVQEALFYSQVKDRDKIRIVTKEGKLFWYSEVELIEINEPKR